MEEEELVQYNNQNQEDLSKYIFDLQNPKAFVVYDLLLKVVKDMDHQVLFDEFFLYELFRDQIFDKEFEGKLWDKPRDFKQLTTKEKANCFIKNFTKADFNNHIINKINNSKSRFSNLFGEFISSPTFKPSNWKSPSNVEVEHELFDHKNIISLLYFDYYASRLSYYESLFLKSRIDQEKNQIIFLTKESDYILQYFTFPRTSIIFTTIEDFEIIRKHSSYNQSSIKPFLLNRIEDIHVLLDYLYRDLNTSASAVNQSEIPYLDSINIKNYFSLKNVELTDLKRSKEIYFLGENGDGKTILLQSILLAIKGNQNEGLINDVVKHTISDSFSLSATDSFDKNYSYSVDAKSQIDSIFNVFAYGVSRFNSHEEKKDKLGYLTLFSNEQYLESPVKWLQYIDYKESKNQFPPVSLEEAKCIVSELLDRNVEIEVTPDDVIFKERGTVLKFEQLSDGYKSVISWTGDLLTRLAENQPWAKSTQEFCGIVLVDEIDMFLHPKWEYALPQKLRNIFPKIQFIFSTHSPILILGASKDAVFYKVFKENAETKVSEAFSYQQISGMLANTIITSPLFDLESSGMRDSDTEPDTSYNYRYSQISKKITERLAKQRDNGKRYFSPEQIDGIIDTILNEEVGK